MKTRPILWQCAAAWGGLVLVLSLSIGCGVSSVPDPAAKPVVALVMRSLAEERFHAMQEGARAHQNAHYAEYDLVVNGAQDSDPARQIALVEQVIAQRVAAIVLAPADPQALVAVCKKAQDAGIIVVNIDSRLADPGKSIPFVGPDNRKGACAAGDYLALRLRPGNTVTIIEGDSADSAHSQRTRGFEEAMKKAGMEVVVAQSGGDDAEKARQAAAALLAEQAELKGILCTDDCLALGALMALKDAGKLGTAQIVGFGNSAAIHDLVADGQILATVDPRSDRQAVYGVEYALEALKNKSASHEDKETPVDLITAEFFH